MKAKYEQPEKRVGYKSPPVFNPNWYDPLSPSDRKVLYFLMDQAEREGTQTISLYAKDIAKALGMSVRMVMNTIKRLEERQYLLRERQRDTRGGLIASKYTILQADRNRREKIKEASTFSGIAETTMIDYVYWLHHHREKYEALELPTVEDVAFLAHCPTFHANQFVDGCIKAGILTPEKVTF